MRQLLITFSLVILLALPVSTLAQNSSAAPHEVYALSYGVYPDFPISALLAGADKTRKIDLQMMIWLIKGPGGKNILVDTGCYHENVVKGKGIKDLIKASDAVAKLGLSAADITDVIISHMHWDHADGMDLFPKARIWIQKGEYSYYTGEAWQQKGTHGGIDQDDVLALVKLNMEGRVTLVSGDNQEIIPGIICYTGGKHTWQSQYVSADSKAGKVVLASDNMYLYENLDKHLPIATTLDADSNLRAQDRMKQIAASLDLIIPGHDPAVFERFPKVAERVVRIE